LPTIDIDGRGKTVEEAVQDMWARMIPLEEKGYHAVSSVEVIDVKSKKIVETFQVTDTEWVGLKQSAAKAVTKKSAEQEHRPPTPHEYPFKARVRLES
jgi:hypothetical protein